MRAFKGALLTLALVTTAAAQSPEPPLSETRLTVHTLLREDVFAGFLESDTTRLSRAEKNADLLLAQRPDARADLMAWKGAMALDRAVLANEAGNAAEFARYYQESLDRFAEAGTLSNGNDGVAPIVAGTYSVLGDQLPAQYRAAAWAKAYEGYSLLWKQQGAGIDQLPVHHKGEVLSGMAQSAQRTGRAEESARFVDRILTMMPGTTYEKAAKQWKADPASAAKTNITCKNCHAPGRLATRLATLNK